MNTLLDIIPKKNLELWQSHLSAQAIDGLSFQEYETLCTQCVNADWAVGIVYLKHLTPKTRHAWYWITPKAHNQPGNALFRACQFAKIQCTRELVKEAEPETLLHALLMGGSSPTRPMRVTQNRVKCLLQIAKELKKHPQSVVDTLISGNINAIRAVLENYHPEVVRGFDEIWDRSQVWSTLWRQMGHYSKDDIFTPSSHTNQWVQSLEFLWQCTSSIDDIPLDVKDHLLAVAQKPENTGIFPVIHSELSKKDIEQALGLQEATPKGRRKKM